MEKNEAKSYYIEAVSVDIVKLNGRCHRISSN